MNNDYKEKTKKVLFTSQDVLDVCGDELLHVGCKFEGFVSDVNDEVFDDCRWGFGGGGADCQNEKIMWKNNFWLVYLLHR